MRIAITGANGQVGRELTRLWKSQAVALRRSECDITNAGLTRRILARACPDVVVNCAAYTRVDAAEGDAAACRAVNVDGVRCLAEACGELGVPLVHFSTDYVFGGDTLRQRPYCEHDTPAPLSVYGQSKLEGERIAGQFSNNLIVRTCGIYAHGGRNFVETILQRAQSGRDLRVVDDQCCTPTSAADLARAVRFLVEAGASGLYHVTNTGQTTWCHFARQIVHAAGLRAPVAAIPTADYGAAAARPHYSVLDTSRYAAASGSPLPSWQDALAAYLAAR